VKWPCRLLGIEPEASAVGVDESRERRVMTEFRLRRNLAGATPIKGPDGEPLSARDEVLQAGTVGFVNGEPYECPEISSPVPCIDLLIRGKLYRVAHRAFRNAAVRKSAPKGNSYGPKR